MPTTFRTAAEIIGEISRALPDFAKVWQETQLNTIALKRVGVDWSKANPDDITHGRLSTPAVYQGEARNDYELYQMVTKRAAELTGGVVTVIGHGFPTPGDRFVWRGDAQAFREYWKGD